MSLFFDGVDDFLQRDSTPVTAAPFTASLWFRADSIGKSGTALFIGDKDVADEQYRLQIAGAVAGDPVRWRIRNSAGTLTIATTTGYSANIWHHACAVEASATDHRVFIDGGSKATSTTSKTVAGSDRLTVGRNGDSTPDGEYDGRVCELAIWNVALTDEEVKALAGGVSPLRIRPDNLVFYAPIFGVGSPEPDYSGGGRHLTLNSVPTQQDHAPVAPQFGFGLGWQGAFTAAAEDGSSARRRVGIGAGHAMRR